MFHQCNHINNLQNMIQQHQVRTLKQDCMLSGLKTSHPLHRSYKYDAFLFCCIILFLRCTVSKDIYAQDGFLFQSAQ